MSIAFVHFLVYDGHILQAVYMRVLRVLNVDRAECNIPFRLNGSHMRRQMDGCNCRRHVNKSELCMPNWNNSSMQLHSTPYKRCR